LHDANRDANPLQDSNGPLQDSNGAVFIFLRFMLGAFAARRGLLRREILGPALYIAASAAFVAVFGIPTHRDLIGLWLLLGLLCFSLSDVRGHGRALVLEWLPFLGILVAYDSLRGGAAHLFATHYLPQLQIDTDLFGTAPTVTLQHWLWHGGVTWYDVIAWAVYVTHFLATPVLAAVLWKIDRPRFRVFSIMVAALSFAGLLTYALYPAAPPWMASEQHLIAPITRIVPHVWLALPLNSAGSLIEHGYRYANDVAAVPSLHAAFSLLVAMTLWPRKRTWLRPFVALYPLAMAFSLVYTGEHYVSDVVLGWTYALGAVLAVQAFLRRRSARRLAGELAADPVS
jgi:membrane-associated phospholipid phosphatase